MSQEIFGFKGRITAPRLASMGSRIKYVAMICNLEVTKFYEDNMRQCYPYQDEQEYSAIQGVQEAIEAGLDKRSEILVHVMKKYRGHLNPEIAMKAIDIIMK